MKKISFLPFFTLLSLPLFAVDTVFLEPVQPVSPVLKAQGGASTANVRGYDALFVNPAAFADPKTSLTIVSLESTLHLPLSALNDILDARANWGNLDLLAKVNPFRDVLNDVITKTGLGQEFSLGSGWVGQNLGLGFLTQGRWMVKGPNLLDAKAGFDTTVMGIIGMAWPFGVGPGTMRVGGSIRPMQKTFSSLSAGELLSNLASLSETKLSSGFGLGIDLGLRWDYEEFTTGLVVRDLGGTELNFKEFTVSEWQKSFGFPSGGDSTGSTVYRIPTVIGLGAGWTPNVGSLASLFQPTLTADFQIPIKDEYSQPSFWTWTHLGAEFLLLKSVAIRTGLNQGYLTFGLGAKIFIVDFNLAIFADEMGRYAGFNRRSGLSVDWAVRL